MDFTLTVVVLVTFLFSGAVKLFGVPQSVAIRDQLGVSPGLWRLIGVLEWLAVAGILVGSKVPLIGTLALVGLVLLMVGATASRLRVRDSAVMIALDVAVLALVVVTLLRQLGQV
jgi:hypothetical protein